MLSIADVLEILRNATVHLQGEVGQVLALAERLDALRNLLHDTPHT
jgi:hypothetical protein